MESTQFRREDASCRWWGREKRGGGGGGGKAGASNGNLPINLIEGHKFRLRAEALEELEKCQHRARSTSKVLGSGIVSGAGGASDRGRPVSVCRET